MPSGGLRAGAGRPRLEGMARDVSGRIKPVEKCVCGSEKSLKSAHCWGCERAARTKSRKCTHCLGDFVWRDGTRGRNCCSDVCARKALEASHIRHRTGKPKQRERRRRACAARRRWLSQSGGRPQQIGRWRRILERDGPSCWLCHLPVDLTTTRPTNRLAPSVDHVVPLSLGGSDRDDNLRLAHFGCNSRRGAGRFNGEVAA